MFQSLKLLICIPSPRDLPDFAEAMKAIPHDKVWIKYTPYSQDPYGQFRKFFLNHPEYTHLAICPDDLIVTVEGVQKLVDDAELYPVIMGTCNVNVDDYPDGEVALTKNLPVGNRDDRVYDFYTRKEIAGRGIIQVPWCGTPFAIFSREIVEKLEFAGDRRWNEGKTSFAYDVGIAHDLKAMGIPIMVDTDVFFFHNRKSEKQHLKNGLEAPQVWYDHDGVREVNKDPTWNYMRLRVMVDEFEKKHYVNDPLTVPIMRKILEILESQIGGVKER